MVTSVSGVGVLEGPMVLSEVATHAPSGMQAGGRPSALPGRDDLTLRTDVDKELGREEEWPICDRVWEPRFATKRRDPGRGAL